VSTLQTVDGRLLTARRPAASAFGGMSSSGFRPMWSNGESDDESGVLKSYEALYRSQPTLAAVVDKLTRRVATLPFDAYKRQPNHGREQVAPSDSLATLIAKPMPRSSRVHLLSHITQSLLIHGNALVAKLRTDPDLPPDMLWPLNWAQISAFGPVGGRIEWWSTTQFDGVERFMRVEDTVHFAWPAPDGSEIGVSPIEKLGVTFRLEDAAQRHQISQFKNGVRPSLAVTIDGDPKVEKLEYARERVKAMQGGVDKAGGVWFMGSNVKLQPLSMSPVEVALIDQRTLSIAEIGRVYDLSGPVMNDLEHGTYSNVQVLLDALYRDVVPVWLGLEEQTFQAQLIDPEPAWLDRFVSFDLTDKLKGDPVQLAQSLKLQVEAGMTTRNEARRIMNLPPIGDPTDPENPANQLTYAVNNQAALGSLNDGTGDTAAPDSPPAP
jgi:HK97 family phage portal protein